MPSVQSIPNLKSKRYFELVGGVQMNASEILSTDSEFEELLNIQSVRLGVLQKAQYWGQFGPAVQAGNTALGATVFEDSSKVGHRLEVIDNAAHTQGQVVEQGVSGPTVRYSGLTAGKVTNFAQTFGYLFATNSTDGLVSTNDLVTWGTVNCLNAPKCDYVVEYQRYLYLFGDPVHPQRVYRGYIQDPNVNAVAYVLHDQAGTLTTIGVDESRYILPGMVLDIFPHGTTTKSYTVTVLTVPDRKSFTVASGSFTLSDTDEIYLTNTKQNNTVSILWDPLHDYFETPAAGQVITMGRVSNNRLILCTENATYRYDGSGLTTVDPNTGCSHNWAAADLGRYTFWAHKGVLYRYDGYVPVPISDSIRSLLVTVPDYSVIRMMADKISNRLFIFLGSVTFPNTGISQNGVWAVYDIFKDKFEFRADMDCAVAFVDSTGTGLPALMVCDTHGNMFQMEAGSSAEFYSAKTKYDSQDAPEIAKHYRYVTTFSTSPGGNLFFSLDFDRSNYQGFGQVTDRIQTFELPPGSDGNFFSLQWTDDLAGDSPNLIGYTVHYDPIGIVVPDR